MLARAVSEANGGSAQWLLTCLSPAQRKGADIAHSRRRAAAL